MSSTRKNKSRSPPIIKTSCKTILTNAWTNLQSYSTKKSSIFKNSKNLLGMASLSSTEATSGDCSSSTCPPTRTTSNSPSIESVKITLQWSILTFCSRLCNKMHSRKKHQSSSVTMCIEHCQNRNCSETKKFKE